MATAAQAQPTTTDPIDLWLVRRAACPQPGDEKRAPAHSSRSITNRANSQHSTGPRTPSGKQRSSQNALRHGLTAQTAVLPTEDPDVYQRHIQKFLDEYKPATPTETQLVHEIANTAWRLNRIPLLEAETALPKSRSPNPDSHACHPRTPRRASLAPVPKSPRTSPRNPGRARRLQRRQLTEAAEIFMRRQNKGLPWDPAALELQPDGFVFLKEQIERHAQHLMRRSPGEPGQGYSA